MGLRIADFGLRIGLCAAALAILFGTADAADVAQSGRLRHTAAGDMGAESEGCRP